MHILKRSISPHLVIVIHWEPTDKEEDDLNFSLINGELICKTDVYIKLHCTYSRMIIRFET